MAKRKSRVRAASPPPSAPEMILVITPDGHPFWERHQDHPGGEVWVAGHEDEPSEAVQVAKTDAVKRALREGRLEIVSRRAVEAEQEAADG